MRKIIPLTLGLGLFLAACGNGDEPESPGNDDCMRGHKCNQVSMLDKDLKPALAD